MCEELSSDQWVYVQNADYSDCQLWKARGSGIDSSIALMCVLSLCCGGVAADVRSDFAFLPLYGVRLVTDSMVSQIGY